MYTTVKISEKLKKRLENMKMTKDESYENVIEDLIEDHLEINPEFRKSIEIAEKEMKRGKRTSLEQIKKGLGI